jgi:hypothetical protein
MERETWGVRYRRAETGGSPRGEIKRDLRRAEPRQSFLLTCITIVPPENGGRGPSTLLMSSAAPTSVPHHAVKRHLMLSVPAPSTLRVERFDIAGPMLFTPVRHEDQRGFFSETFNAQALADAGVFENFVQDNHSRSEPVHVLRGLHFQISPLAQSKLVRVVRGAILDVCVDLRRSSPTYAPTREGRAQSGKLAAALCAGWVCPRILDPGTADGSGLQGQSPLLAGTRARNPVRRS